MYRVLRKTKTMNPTMLYTIIFFPQNLIFTKLQKIPQIEDMNYGKYRYNRIKSDFFKLFESLQFSKVFGCVWSILNNKSLFLNIVFGFSVCNCIWGT